MGEKMWNDVGRAMVLNAMQQNKKLQATVDVKISGFADPDRVGQRKFNKYDRTFSHWYQE
jgi:hypothetical protein